MLTQFIMISTISRSSKW